MKLWLIRLYWALGLTCLAFAALWMVEGYQQSDILDFVWLAAINLLAGVAALMMVFVVQARMK